MELVAAAALAAFMLSITYAFVKIAERQGIAKAFIAALILADLFVILLMLLGIDRPLIIIKTRLGSTTITYLQVFLLLKVPFTIWSIVNREQLRRILG
ncbi:hypothetical protein J4526_01810 [Desulfurococcaceae archaeon MEX13E-LK6-19]|nr:hypothetical protein J4526_01810 [Desulfurococcaceae archaeon MEX13E-LK6-19]